MGYVQVRSFLQDTFPGRVREILDEAYSRCGIIDIDAVDSKKKKQFADYILKYHLNFSPQKNRYLYDQLLQALGIGSMFDMKDFRKTIEIEKKGENVVLSALKEYWLSVKQAFNKYEAILNVYWMKGVEAELHGVDKNYVKNVINKSLVAVNNNTEEAYTTMMETLDLVRYMKKKRGGIFRLSLFGDVQLPSPKAPDEETQFIIDNIHVVKDTVDKSVSDLKEIMFDSLDKDFEMRKKNEDDSRFLEDLKARIIREYEYVSQEYDKIYKKMEEKLKLS